MIKVIKLEDHERLEDKPLSFLLMRTVPQPKAVKDSSTRDSVSELYPLSPKCATSFIFHTCGHFQE